MYGGEGGCIPALKCNYVSSEWLLSWRREPPRRPRPPASPAPGQVCSHTAFSETRGQPSPFCPYGKPALGIRDPRQETERGLLPPSPLRWDPCGIFPSVAGAWGDLPLRGPGDLPERSRRFADRRLRGFHLAGIPACPGAAEADVCFSGDLCCFVFFSNERKKKPNNN